MSNRHISLGGTPLVRLPEPTKQQLCGGDLHRARAPLPPPPFVPDLDRGFTIPGARRGYTKPAKRTYVDPRKAVIWDEATVAELLNLINKEGFTREGAAKELNKRCPQRVDVFFTKNCVISKINRLKKGD